MHFSELARNKDRISTECEEPKKASLHVRTRACAGQHEKESACKKKKNIIVIQGCKEVKSPRHMVAPPARHVRAPAVRAAPHGAVQAARVLPPRPRRPACTISELHCSMHVVSPVPPAPRAECGAMGRPAPCVGMHARACTRGARPAAPQLCRPRCPARRLPAPARPPHLRGALSNASCARRTRSRSGPLDHAQ